MFVSRGKEKPRLLSSSQACLAGMCQRLLTHLYLCCNRSSINPWSWSPRNSHTLLVRGTAPWKSLWPRLITPNRSLLKTQQFHSEVCITRVQMYHQKALTRMFTVSLSLRTTNWKLPKFPCKQNRWTNCGTPIQRNTIQK